MSKRETRRRLVSAMHLIDNMTDFNLPWANDYITECIGPDKGPDPYEEMLFGASKELMLALRHLLNAKTIVIKAKKKAGV
jgi:hypothetical protein